MQKKIFLSVISLFSFMGISHAQDIHQCTINGKVVFQARPCPQTTKTLGDVLNISQETIDAKREADERAEKDYSERLKLSAAQRGDLVVVQKYDHVAVDQLKAGVKPMPFKACKKYVNDARLSTPANFKTSIISDTASTYLARICRKDGSIVLACSASDKKLVLSKSMNCPL